MPETTHPRIVVTLASAADHRNPGLVGRRNGLYLDAIARHGGAPVGLDSQTAERDVAAALVTMDGLLLTGGADIDPARYGQPTQGAVDVEPERDALEARAWEAATARDVPVLGICRGLQAINVFSGGSLLQHVAGHEGASWGSGAPAIHPLRLVPGTRLASLLLAGGAGNVIEVNAYHHQGILQGDVAPGLVPAGWADSSEGPLVEGLEAPGPRFIVGVQCHPERQESTPPVFERLFEAFVDAAR
jgi:gamma-glutamyl-gamma-aminobutyrate hydrolase PuuD